MRTIPDVGISGRSLTFSREAPGISATGVPQPRPEERKVHFQSAVGGRDKKYEGYSLAAQRGPAIHGRKDEKENTKDRKLDDEFIHNLHQHIYFLEMQLKLIKDKDIESKKGGLDALFRDGIPLNENFLALKNRYKKEKKELEEKLTNLEKQTSDTNANNTTTARKIEMIGEEYQQLTKQHEAGINAKKGKERELRGKLFDENRAILELKEDLDKKGKELSQLKSGNAYMLRIQEKNKMFGENKEEKELLEAEKRNNDMIQHCLKKVIEAGIELEFRKRQYDDMSMIKELDTQNMELIKTEGSINREIAVARGKISELENLHDLNVKYIEEEATQKRRLVREQESLQKDLEHKSKLKEEELKEYLKEKEQSQISELQTKIEIGDSEIEYFINLLRNTEERVKVLAEEKSRLQEQLTENRENVNMFAKERADQKKELAQETHNIEILSIDLDHTKQELQTLGKENEHFHGENEKIAKTIPEHKAVIDGLKQRIQLNEMLKEVDVDELKMLKQNNMSVNSAIAGLVTRWESLEGKHDQFSQF